jgi:hypothetical protein
MKVNVHRCPYCYALVVIQLLNTQTSGVTTCPNPACGGVFSFSNYSLESRELSEELAARGYFYE